MIINTKCGTKCHISDGNKKLGSIPAFNLPPIKACAPQACQFCGKDCYAMKDYRLKRKNVITAHADNLELVLEHLPELEQALDWFFNNPNAPRFFRLHSAGDFVTLEYAQMWFRIIKNHPGTNFLIFSKHWDHVRQVPFHQLENCRLYLSDWPGMVIPEDLKQIYNIAWMNDGTRPEQLFQGSKGCPGNCSNCFGCWLAPGDVTFNKH